MTIIFSIVASIIAVIFAAAVIIELTGWAAVIVVGGLMLLVRLISIAWHLPTRI